MRTKEFLAAKRRILAELNDSVYYDTEHDYQCETDDPEYE